MVIPPMETGELLELYISIKSLSKTTPLLANHSLMTRYFCSLSGKGPSFFAPGVGKVKANC